MLPQLRDSGSVAPAIFLKSAYSSSWRFSMTADGSNSSNARWHGSTCFTLCRLTTGYAGHFVLAQLLPANLKDYDVLLAAQLQNVTAAEAAVAQSIATTAATELLQNRQGCCSPLTCDFCHTDAMPY